MVPWHSTTSGFLVAGRHHVQFSSCAVISGVGSGAVWGRVQGGVRPPPPRVVRPLPFTIKKLRLFYLSNAYINIKKKTIIISCAD